MLKSRVDIDQVYDTFKNTINADCTYVRDYHQLNGWMFVNFITLILHYRICGRLMKHGALRKYYSMDVLEHMESVHMIRIGKEWKISEIPKKTRAVMEKPEIPTVQNNGS